MKYALIGTALLAVVVLLTACVGGIQQDLPYVQAGLTNQAPMAIIKYSLFPVDAVLNGAPGAGIEQQVATFAVPAKVKVWGNESIDADGRLVAYRWTMNGRSLSTSQNPTPFVLDSPGLYALVLTVTDDDGASHTSQAQFHLFGKANQALPPSRPGPPTGGAVCAELTASLSGVIKDCRDDHPFMAFARGVALDGAGNWLVTTVIAAKVDLELASFVDQDTRGVTIGSGFSLGLSAGERSSFSYMITAGNVTEIRGLARGKPVGVASETVSLNSRL